MAERVVLEYRRDIDRPRFDDVNVTGAGDRAVQSVGTINATPAGFWWRAIEKGLDGMQIFVEIYRAANPIAGVPMVGVTRGK